MWRASRFSMQFGRRLFISFHHPQPCFSLPKTLESFPHLSTTTPTFHHPRFWSHSSVSEFDNENHHDHTSSSEDLEPHDVETNENSDAQIGSFGLEPHDVENSDAQMGSLGSNEEQTEGVVGVDVGKLENVLSLLQSSSSSGDESLEFRLDGMGLGLSEEFVVRVLETPLIPGDHLIRFFKWVLGKNEDFVVTTSMLGLLSRSICSNEPRRKDVYALWDLVQEIAGKESGVVSTEILNELISAFSKMGKGKAAFEVVNKFEQLGCVANSDSYYLAIEALSKRSFYDWAGVVSQKMLSTGILPESEKIGSIISMFCKGRREKDAHVIYLAAREKNKYPPQKPVNFLISCLSKGDETVPLAQQMLGEFSAEARKGGINPFSWVVRGLCRKGESQEAKKLVLEMIEKGPPPGNAVFNLVVNAFAKGGDMEDAKGMLKLMESRGLKPDGFAYSVIISGYAKAGLMEEACKVLSEAREKHDKLHPVTFHSIIRGYCKLEQFDKALKVLSEMKEYGVEANVDEYNKLIQSLCLKALDWQTAEKLLEEMKDKGLHLPGITRALISSVKELEQEAVVSEDAVAKA